MLKSILKEKKIASLIATITYCLLILPINESISFSLSNLSHKSLITSYILKLFFAIFLYFSFLFIFNFFDKITKKDKRYIDWLIISTFYFIFMFVFFLILYPGHWVYDEFIILDAVKHYSLFAWQGYMTNIYYTFCLYLCPTGLSIVIFQIIVSSLVVGYITSTIKKIFKRDWLSFLLIIPFLFIPVIINNLYPLRLTLYSYIELILIFKLICIHFSISKPNNIYYELLSLSIMITTLCFWRTEGFFYLLMLPYIIYKLKIFDKKRYKQITPYIYTTASLVIILFGYSINKLTNDPKYQLSASLTPLSTMVQVNLKGDNIKQSLNSINKVVDLNILKKYPNYNETSLWLSENVLKDNYFNHIDEYNKAFLYVVYSNPMPFLESRIKTFTSTNSLETSVPQVGQGMRFFSDNKTHKAVVDNFLSNNYLTHPISVKLKQEATERLLTIAPNGDGWSFKNTQISKYVWTIIPTILILAIFGLYNLIRKRYFWTIISILIITRAILLFLTSPANYFMYYLPVYMSGNFLLALNLLIFIDRKVKFLKT